MGMVGRVRVFAVASVGSILLALGGGEAHAAGKGAAPAKRPDASAQGGLVLPPGPGQAARARAKAGDCAGALDGFDQAVSQTIEPTLRRDRGLCHEQLGHPYPAIDDYRYYLTERPNAPDADAIRGRLQRLEQQVGIVSQEAQDKEKEKDKESKTSARASGSVSLTLNGATLTTESGGGPRNLDTIERDEKLDIQADESPLRRGTGFEI